MTTYNALYRASFYVERLKNKEGLKNNDKIPIEEAIGLFEDLLKEVGITNITAQELLESSTFFAQILAQLMWIHPEHALSCWVDGVMHGIALASGLGLDQPDKKRPEIDPSLVTDGKLRLQ